LIAATTIPSEVELKGQGLVPAKTDPLTGKIVLDASGKPLLDYDLAIPSMLLHYFPDRHSWAGTDGAAGQLHERHGGQCYGLQHCLDLRLVPVLHQQRGQRRTTWPWAAGLLWEASLLSMATAYAATGFNNIMDTLQLVFSFVNAPLFATFLLGMFWKRATGNGAFIGLISGTVAACCIMA
jgi:SSS family solute:Na+ symporter